MDFHQLPEREQEIRRQAYSDYHNEIARREQSNTEQYDKAILSLSIAGLGFSIGFLKDFVKPEAATYLVALYLSWVSLTVAIISTILSFKLSQYALYEQYQRAKEFYLQGKEEAFSASKSAKLVDKVNNCSGGFFLAGIILTVFFTIANMQEVRSMANQNKFTFPGLIQNGATVPTMQTVPSTQPPASPPASPPAQPASPTNSDASE